MDVHTHTHTRTHTHTNTHTNTHTCTHTHTHTHTHIHTHTHAHTPSATLLNNISCCSLLPIISGDDGHEPRGGWAGRDWSPSNPRCICHLRKPSQPFAPTRTTRWWGSLECRHFEEVGTSQRKSVMLISVLARFRKLPGRAPTWAPPLKFAGWVCTWCWYYLVE